MGWIIDKVMRPRKSIGLKIFPIPIIQLGDIVNIEYKDINDINLITSSEKKFLVYNIEYTRSEKGPDMTLYLSEV